MRKTKQAIRNALDELSAEMTAQFPGLDFETVEHPGDGYDAWLLVYTNDEQDKSVMKTRYAAYDLADALFRRTGISLMPMIRNQKEPVHG